MSMLQMALRPILSGLFIAISAVVLGVCVYFSYSAVSLVPYPGVQFNSTWVVEATLPCQINSVACFSNQDLLKPGDQMLNIGKLNLAEFLRDRASVAFEGYRVSDIVPITFRRVGVLQTIQWHYVGSSPLQQLYRLRSILIYLPFWLAGVAALFLLRPRNQRWRIMIWFNFILAMWLAALTVSSLHVGYAAEVEHVLAWLLVPICINFHLVVPSLLLERHKRVIMASLYLTGFGLAIAEAFGILPADLHWVGLLFGFVASIALLGVRVFNKSRRKDLSAVRLMLGGICVAFIPTVAIAVGPRLFGISPAYSAQNFAAFTIPILPLAYVYAIYKRNLGGLEFRANQLLSRYSFTLLYLTGLGIALMVLADRLEVAPLAFVLFFGVAALFVTIAPYGLERFQRWFNRMAYGMRYEPDQIVRALADQIPSLLNSGDLAKIVRDEVVPSLLIRECGLYVLNKEGAQLFCAEGRELPETLQVGPELAELTTRAGHYKSPRAPFGTSWNWVRLVIELRVRENSVGFWLLGRRDPDDFYSSLDLRLLEMLGNQIAVALENIRLLANQTEIAAENARLFTAAQQELAERKRTEVVLKYYSNRMELLSQELVAAQETERQRVASDLHDSVVQWLTASLFRVEAARQLMDIDTMQTGQELNEIEAGIKHSIHELRTTIVRLHPPELEIQGLAPALQQYIRHWRADTKINALLQVQGVSRTFPLTVETGLYRICQEALNNVAKHSHATVTNVDLAYAPDAVSLRVQDNGVGFDSKSHPTDYRDGDPENPPVPHFGLMGMSGRAKNIGGKLEIESRKDIGTTILVTVPLKNEIGEGIYG